MFGDTPSNDTGVLTAGQLTGLGMAGDTVIAGRTLPGGIVYRDLEVLNIVLGTGNDTFHVLSTHAGSTNIASGAGNDIFYVQSIDGHTAIDAGAGDDVVNVGSEAAPNLLGQNGLGTIRALLIVIGGTGNDTLFIDNRAEDDDGASILGGNSITGLGMPSVSEVQTVYIQAAAGIYTLRIADRNIDSKTATSTLVELSGTPIMGDRWTIAIDTLPFYTVQVQQGMTTVARWPSRSPT